MCQNDGFGQKCRVYFFKKYNWVLCLAALESNIIQFIRRTIGNVEISYFYVAFLIQT